jgi:hypothetical protein
MPALADTGAGPVAVITDIHATVGKPKDGDLRGAFAPA